MECMEEFFCRKGGEGSWDSSDCVDFLGQRNDLRGWFSLDFSNSFSMRISIVVFSCVRVEVGVHFILNVVADKEQKPFLLDCK